MGLYVRISGISIMMAGIRSVGFLFANLLSNFIDNRMARKLGEGRTERKQYIIICNFKDQATEIAHNIPDEEIPVLILSQTKPCIEDPHVDYVNITAINTKDLEGPGISKCKTAVILADRRNEGEEILRWMQKQLFQYSISKRWIGMSISLLNFCREMTRMPQGLREHIR